MLVQSGVQSYGRDSLHMAARILEGFATQGISEPPTALVGSVTAALALVGSNVHGLIVL